MMSPDGVLAVLADVHGNRWALDAVLEDLDRRGIRNVLNLGDSLYGPLDPAGTAQRLRAIASVSVRGNQDRILLEPDEAAANSPTFRFVTESLAADDMAWLGRHEPAPLRVGALTLCHGTPQHDDRYLVERVTESGVELESSGTLETELAAVEGAVVMCAHSHVPRLLLLPGGLLVVNPGSVGLPAYTADDPLPHAMEAGSPHARYAVLEEQAAGWTVEHVALAYDWERAAAAAERHGRGDWAGWLRSGRAAP
jgi:predicted phosphodiesterase